MISSGGRPQCDRRADQQFPKRQSDRKIDVGENRHQIGEKSGIEDDGADGVDDRDPTGDPELGGEKYAP